MASKRSPLKDRPLRNPGQSLDEQIRDLISDYAWGPLVFALFMVFVAPGAPRRSDCILLGMESS